MALQLVAEAALSSCFQTLFQQLGPILHSRHLWNWGVGEELKRLERKLSRIQVVLNDAEARILDEKVNFWVEDLRELVYDMEDIIDDMNTKRLQLDQAASSQAGDYQVGNFSFPFKMVESVTKVPVNIMMKGKIVEVLGRLDEISLEADALGFKNETRGTSSMTYQARLNPETGPFVDESEVYGREKDKENIIDLLTTSTCSSKKRYTVIPIVGMGGIGKTTLAQLVFNDQRLENYFDLKSWACVSDVVDIKKVTKELVEFATKENCSDMAFVALQGRLREMVMNKRCLLVLDDVWMAKQWEKLVAPLNCCANGSKILITTRIEKVAKEICNSGGYELKNLEEETCWDLFKEKAFQEVDAYTNGNLENIGRGIVKKCRGVPLAVKVVGAILRDAAEEKWESVLRNDLWQIVDGDDDENFPALRMSYHYLPSHLKRCFEYLSLFPTDYSLDEGELARMWIAEGLIAAQKDRLLEDIASEYYEEMKRRSLIQNDNRMHDLVHSLSCLVSKKFYCRVPNDSLSCKMERIRHASLFDKRVKVTDLDLLLQAKSLRTLLHIDGKYSIFDESSSYALWERISKWNLLRVLDIGKADTVELLSCIGNLKPLRYLHLSLNSEIRNLPDSVCELYNLQTLDVSQCQLNSLPKDIGNLQNLRYLNLSYASIVTLPSSISKLMNLVTLKLSGCESLVEVAENIGNLLSLREFDLGHCYKLQHLPNSICKLHNLKVLNLSSCIQLSHLLKGIGDIQNLPDSVCELYNLQTLDFSLCRRLNSLPKDIGNLQNLRYLNLSSASIVTLLSSISKLMNLVTLKLSGCKSLVEVAENIGNLLSLREFDLGDCYKLQHLPNSICKLHNLKVLILRSCIQLSHLLKGIGEIQNLPDSVCELYNLQTLDFSRCQGLNSLPKDIGNLQNLRYLNLSSASIVTLPSSISKLMNLVTLILCYCKSLVEVAENIGNLLSLREFDLGHCYKLQHLPNSICKLHNLKVLNLSSCMQLSHLPEGIGDLQNLRELLLRKIPILSLPESICKLSRLEVLDLSSCSHLTHLPKDVGDLERLKRLDLEGTYLSLPDSIVKITCLQALGNMRNCPPHVGKLANLKCLEQYIVGKETGRRIGELKNLNNLEGSLVISHLENVDSGKEASMADLKRKKHISGLTFEWSPLLPVNDDGGGSSMVVRDEEVELKVLEALEPDSTAVTYLSFVCYNGNKFPEWMFEARFSSLECLEMKGLNKIRSVVDLELPLLMKLEIINCPSLKDVLMVPPKLNELRVENCQELSGLFLLPSVQDNDSNSNMISRKIDLPQLTGLTIRKCPNLRQVFMAVPLLRYLVVRDLSLAVNGLLPPILECLYIDNCENLELLLKDGQQLPKLWVLSISNCENLKSLFKDGQEMPKLWELSISNCENLKSLFKDGQKLPELKTLEIKNCDQLRLLAMDWTSAPKLQSLTLKACPQLVSFPDGNEKLPPTLTSLTLEDCPQLVLLPEEGLTPALESLNILGCPQLESFPACHNLTSLKYINVCGCPQLESFPEVCLPPMLGGLRIKSCKNLRYLPKDLCNLTSLFRLEIEDCPEVEARPDDRLPPNFHSLLIERCPKLEQQLKEENRSDWLRLM